MKFAKINSFELQDIYIPEIFFINNINSLKHIDVKVYIYICYLSQKQIELDEKSISSRLGITLEELNYSLKTLEQEELLIKTVKGFDLIDIKEKEIVSKFTPKLENKLSDKEKKAEVIKQAAATTIAECYFAGNMSFSWYSEIGIMFEKYKFTEDVMIALFNHCNNKQALNKKYVNAVAENWFKGGVLNFSDLEKYQEKMTKQNTIYKKITKELRLNRNLTIYEEKLVKVWIEQYNYDFSMIQEALSKTVNKTSPSIKYVDGILKKWHEKGFKTKKDITEEKKTVVVKKESKLNTFSQRKYDDLDSYYDNM